MSSPDARGPWGDGETWALIEAWGPMHLGYNGRSLHVAEWRQICSAVNAYRVAAGRRFYRSLVQCQKRVDTLKDQYKKELAKGQPTPGWRHFAQLRAFLTAPPSGFAAKMPPASVMEEMSEEEEEEEEEATGGASGSVERRTVPAKRHFSSLLHRSSGPTSTPATATAKEEKEVKEEVGREGPASAGCNPAAVLTELAALTTKLAEVYERVEMERLSVEKEKRAAKRWRPRIWEKPSTINQLTHGDLAKGFKAQFFWASRTASRRSCPIPSFLEKPPLKLVRLPN